MRREDGRRGGRSTGLGAEIVEKSVGERKIGERKIVEIKSVRSEERRVGKECW